MTTHSIPLFQALGAKMDYLGQRQRVIAQNISNSDTPGYRPHDLKPVDFSGILKDISGGTAVKINTTNPLHMPASGTVPTAKEGKQKDSYEVAPAGNAVIMEEQLINSGQTVTDYNLVTSLYQKNVRLLKIAMGTQ